MAYLLLAKGDFIQSLDQRPLPPSPPLSPNLPKKMWDRPLQPSPLPHAFFFLGGGASGAGFMDHLHATAPEEVSRHTVLAACAYVWVDGSMGLWVRLL